MRALKFWTTSLLVFGIFMLMAAPIIMVRKPGARAPEVDRLRFAALMTSYAIVLLIVFLAIVILAWRLMVRQREEFRDASLTNLKDLVEGTMQDHGRPEDPKDES